MRFNSMAYRRISKARFCWMSWFEALLNEDVLNGFQSDLRVRSRSIKDYTIVWIQNICFEYECTYLRLWVVDLDGRSTSPSTAKLPLLGN